MIVLFGEFSEAEPKDLGADLCDDEPAVVDYGYHSDSDLEDVEDDEPNRPTPAPDESSTSPSSRPYGLMGEENRYENHAELASKGKVVRIPDMAFVT